MSEFGDASTGGPVSGGVGSGVPGPVDPVPVEVRVLDAGAVLAQMVGERAAAEWSQARVLALAVHFVDLHPMTEECEAATWEPQAGLLAGEVGPRLGSAGGGASGVGSAGLGGVGTPGVARFAVEELGGVLGVSYGSALQLVADSVELCFRLPRLWAAVQSGRMPVWRARQVARETVGLCEVGVEFVDRQVAVLVARRRFPTVGQVREVVHQARLLTDPEWETAVEEMALGRRGVWFDHQTSTASAATTSMSAVLDAWDALDLDAALGDLAGSMGRLGDTSPVDVRRAGALALLAHPQRVLDLTTAVDTLPDSADGADTAPAAAPGDVAAGPGASPVHGDGPGFEGWRSPESGVTLYVHANLADLALGAAQLPRSDGPGVAGGSLPGQVVLERFGPAALGVVRGWLGRAERVTVRPVLHLTDPAGLAGPTDLPDPAGPTDLAGPPGPAGLAGLVLSGAHPVDGHDPPDRMREEVVLRDGRCVFPGCGVPARRCDVDHMVAYRDPADGGPPGQTSGENLACLCRRHHRLKTFTGWDYQRVAGGGYRWSSPRGMTLSSWSLPTGGPPWAPI